MQYSVILPTFGRPDEVTNFLESMVGQKFTDFEVIVVDGSLDDVLHPVIDAFRNKLSLNYFHERGLGASESRNLGCEKARGHFLVFIDSDCVVPDNYFIQVDNFLKANPEIDAFGGPDAAEKNFKPFQKAVNYAMTSMLTTGGIRGKKKHAGKFQLRGFNMGVMREAFFHVGGYSGMQVAEDIDLSMRLLKAGYQTALIPEAFVYHRRKANFKVFGKQLYFHGKGRIDLHLKHGDALKLVHMLPSFFVAGLLIGLLVGIFVTEILFLVIGVIGLYALAVLIDSTIQNRSLIVGILSIVSSLELLITYGSGVWRNIFVRMILKRGGDSKKSAELKK
ncbi:MAG: glycosyltransferase [Bacteroidales bacterium]|nr:glycosyltransferase [Bacteroidales bacterium]MBN2820106.1 glycosyltransferase [Bacteroidales bacterium]